MVFAKGSRGEDVKMLQKYLTTVGFSTGGIDGIYGSNTSRAVLDFQREWMRRGTSLNPDPVHDYVDQATFEALTQAYSSHTSQARPLPSGDAPPMVMPEMTIEGDMPMAPKSKIMLVGAVLIGLAGLLYLTGGSKRSPAPAPAMSGRKLKRGRHLGDSKIWKQIAPGRWEIERVVSSDPREQKRWLQILKQDEPTEKFKLSKTRPTGLNRYK